MEPFLICEETNAGTSAGKVPDRSPELGGGGESEREAVMEGVSGGVRRGWAGADKAELWGIKVVSSVFQSRRG